MKFYTDLIAAVGRAIEVYRSGGTHGIAVERCSSIEV